MQRDEGKPNSKKNKMTETQQAMDVSAPPAKKQLAGGLFYTLENENSFPLPALPADVLRCIASYLPESDQSSIGNRRIRNHRLLDIFRPGAVQKFLLHVVHGEFAQVEAMIRQDPSLLYERMVVEDYSGRKIEGTALQIALSAGDVNLGAPCDVIRVAMLPTPDNLDRIQLSKISDEYDEYCKTAYVRYADKLFYIDKTNKTCTEIPVDAAKIKQFDQDMKPKEVAQRLTEEQLKRITELTGHIHEEGMAEMLRRYLKKLPQGEEIIAQQTSEYFPDGWEEQEKARQERDLQELKKVFAAINAEQDMTKCEAAVTAFTNYLAKQKEGIIKSGKHSNLHLVEESFRLYDEYYERFGNDWDSPKNILSWRRVVGGIQRYATACDAQAFCQGFYYIAVAGEKLRRSLEFRFGRGVHFYPLGGLPGFRLGIDYVRVGGSRGSGGVALWAE